MKYFVLRNNTIEPLFNNHNTYFSGYDDVGLIREDVDIYVWFYQVPFNVNSKQLSQEIISYYHKLELVRSTIGNGKLLIVLSLESLYYLQLLNNDLLVKDAINTFNRNAINLSKTHTNVKWIDLSEFTDRYSQDQLIDWKFFFISQMQINPKLAKEFQSWFYRKIEEVELKRKKCLVLDLDNTLWGGVLGEDGAEGLRIDGDYPGKAYSYWQRALLELAKTGVILTICSKNNEQDVLNAWEENPFIILKKEHFSAWRINWNDKASNIQEIAQELNIGLDSMVFIDDNPSERELVKQMLPMVEVPDFPTRPYGLMQFFKLLVDKYFRIYSVTNEDKSKTEQYKANAQRAAEQKKFVVFEDFIRSLRIEIHIMSANKFNIPRIAQMTQKTNQFNLTTKRYTEQDIYGFIENKWKIYCINVKDKFGDSGITGTIFLKPLSNNEFEIDTLLLSCRVLGKGIENAFLTSIVNHLYELGITAIKAQYIPTSKNNQVFDFYDRNGFELIKYVDNIKYYYLKLNQRKSNKDYYKITFQ